LVLHCAEQMLTRGLGNPSKANQIMIFGSSNP
jgi:hypothetical protein